MNQRFFIFVAGVVFTACSSTIPAKSISEKERSVSSWNTVSHVKVLRKEECLKIGKLWIKNDDTDSFECKNRYERNNKGIIYDWLHKYEWQDNYDSNNKHIKKATWKQARDYCEKLNLDGGGWQLPTQDELDHLTFQNSEYPYDEKCWWSARKGFTDLAGYRCYGSATVGSLNIVSTEKKFVRCIRKKRDLEWQDNYDDNGGKLKRGGWAEGVQYCKNLKLNGGGWRLPEIKELISTEFIKSKFQKDIFWQSNTKWANSDKTWKWNITKGAIKDDLPLPKYYIRCVRGKKKRQSNFEDTRLKVIIQDRKRMWDPTLYSKGSKLGYHDWRKATDDELFSIVDLTNKKFMNKIFSKYISRDLIDHRTYKGIPIYFQPQKRIYSTYNVELLVRDMDKNDRIYKFQKTIHHKPISTQGLRNVKVIDGLLWEDQEFNKKNNISYNVCEQHCASLNLLGMREWRVPKRDDFYILGSDNMRKFDNIAPGGTQGVFSVFTAYITSDSCLERPTYRDISQENCIDTVHIANNRLKFSAHSKNDNEYQACRCVMDVETYNDHLKDQTEVLETTNKKKDLDFYIQRAKLTDNINDLKKAQSLAVTKTQKAKVEKAFIDFIGDYWKIFKLSSRDLPTGKSQTSTMDYSFLLEDISDYKHIKYKIKLSRKLNSPIPLKYGRYQVKVRFIFEYDKRYMVQLGIFGAADSSTQQIAKEVMFHLNPENSYTDSKQVDFGQVLSASEGRMLVGVKSSVKITGAKLKTQIEDIKLQNSMANPLKIENKILQENNRWKAKIVIDKLKRGKISGEIEFKALNCGGSLIYRGIQNEGYLFKEKITYGSSCIKGCTIWIDRDGSFYEEKCNGSSEGGNLSVVQ